MSVNNNYFNKDVLKSYNEIYKISTLSSLSESNVDLLLRAGFVYNYDTNNFTSNIVISNNLFNIIITYNDSNFRMYVKSNTVNQYSESTNKFSGSAKKLLIKSISNSKYENNYYEYNIEYLLFKFESWVEKTEYSNIKNILINKISNKTYDIDYIKDSVLYNKINNSKIFVKINDEKSEAYDISNKILSKDDLINIDKIITEKIKENDEKNNTKLSFNQFSAEVKNMIQ